MKNTYKGKKLYSVTVASLVILILSGCSSPLSGDSAKKANAQRNACKTFTSKIYNGIMSGTSDAFLAAAALYVYGQAKKSGNNELIDASGDLYDGFNLPSLPMLGKAVVDLKLLCEKK